MSAFLFVLVLATGPDTVELTLGQALELALRQSPVRTQVSVSQTQSASSLARSVSGLLPTVSGTVGYAKLDLDQGHLPDLPSTGWTGSLTLSQVVFDPSVFTALAGSVVYSGYYATDAHDKQARLIYDVTKAYLELLRARLLADAADAALRRAQENLRLVRERERLNAVSKVDAMRAQVLESQAVLARLEAEKGLAVAAETFKAMVNIEPGVTIRLSDELTEPSDLDISRPESMLVEIRRKNPGLKLATSAAAAARITSWGKAARVLPSVSAYWTSEYADRQFPSSVARWRDHDQVSYGLRFSFPLLDLKSYVLDLVDAVNESRRTRAAARSAALTLNSTATAAILSYQEAKQTYAHAASNLKLHQELYALAQEQYRLGSLSLADLAGVEADMAQAQATYTSALCDTYIQAAQVNYLLGSIELPGKERR
ncbi:MAG: TolC family protein [candidate division WOR-3 bacterium]